MFDRFWAAVKGAPAGDTRRGSASAFGLWLVMGLAALAVSGCSTRSKELNYNTTGFVQPDVRKALDVSKDYRVGAGDVLSVSVYNVPEFTGEYSVDGLGRLRMPLVGDIMAQGMTADEVDAEVTTRLASTYLRNPDVRIWVKEAAARRITVDGSVGQPGMYAITGDMTLVQSIALARGVSAEANPRRIVIFRNVNGARMAAGFDLVDIRKGKMPDPQVYQDDVIVVDGTKTRTIVRDALTAIPILGLFARF